MIKVNLFQIIEEFKQNFITLGEHFRKTVV